MQEKLTELGIDLEEITNSILARISSSDSGSVMTDSESFNGESVKAVILITIGKHTILRVEFRASNIGSRDAEIKELLDITLVQ